MDKELSSGGNDPSVTQSLRDWKNGDADSFGLLVERLYSELHRMAAHALSSEHPGHTLQPTALINELYLRLRASDPPDWQGRTHFFAVAATTMRRILIDHARASRAERRGGDRVRIPLEFAETGVSCSYDDLLIVDAALTQLERADPRAARVTELVFFGGLEQSEVAKELGVSEITVKRDWKFARAWLAFHFKARQT